MVARRTDYDVAVVGASIAGCTAAMLLARAGARVALIEKRSDPASFKRVCGHYIQPSGVPVLDRLGVLEDLERLGGHRGRGRVWSRYGWIGPAVGAVETGTGDTGPDTRSLNVRREVLDPLLRRLAAETPGVDLMLGGAVEELITGDDGAAGVLVRGPGDRGVRVTARVVVGADGRGSRVAELAGLKTRTSPNRRFAYWGYFEGGALAAGTGVQLWLLEPDVAIVTPTDSGLTQYVAFPDRSRLPEFKRDLEGAVRSFMAALPDPPPVEEARLVSPIIGKLDLTNEIRRPAGDGVALVGDAALAADPVGAVGCGWALQSGSWLADALAPALAGAEPVPAALRRYRRRHRRELFGHWLVTSEFARSRRMNPIQRLMFSAAVRDPRTAAHLEAFAGRMIRPSRFLAPAAIARAAHVRLRRSSPPASARPAA